MKILKWMHDRHLSHSAVALIVMAPYVMAPFVIANEPRMGVVAAVSHYGSREIRDAEMQLGMNSRRARIAIQSSIAVIQADKAKLPE